MNNAQKQNIAQVYLLNLVFTIFALVFSCICYFLRDMFRDPMDAFSVALFFSAIGAVALVVNKLVYLRDRNWFSFDILFYFVFCLLHLGIAVRWLIGGGLPEMSPYTDVAYHLFGNIPQVALLSASGGLAFVLAFLWFSRLRVERLLPEKMRLWQIPRVKIARRRFDLFFLKKQYVGKKYQLQILRKTQRIAILISGLALAAMVIEAGVEYFYSAYSGGPESYTARISDQMFWPVFRIGFLICLVCWAIEGVKFSSLLAICFYLFVMLFYLVLGDRGGVARTAVAGVFLISVLRYSIRWWQLLLLFFIASIIIMFAGEARRSEQRTFRAFMDKGFESLEEKDTVPFLLSGASHYPETLLPALVMAVEIPDNDSFFYGYWSMKGVLAIVPFHFRLFPFLKKDLQFGSSSSYLSHSLNPALYGRYGSSIVAETYLDFGFAGVLLALFITGMLGGIFYRRMRVENVLVDHVILYSLFSGIMVFVTRASFTGPLMREVLWPMLIYFLIKKYVISFGVKKHNSLVCNEKPVTFLK